MMLRIKRPIGQRGQYFSHAEGTRRTVGLLFGDGAPQITAVLASLKAVSLG